MQYHTYADASSDAGAFFGLWTLMFSEEGVEEGSIAYG